MRCCSDLGNFGSRKVFFSTTTGEETIKTKTPKTPKVPKIPKVKKLSEKLQFEQDLKALNVDNKPWAILIDSPLVVLKSHYGIKFKLQLQDGTATSGLFGYMKVILKYMAMKPQYFVAAWEGGRSFRKDISSDYKENRVKLTDDTKAQLQYAYDSTIEMGINVARSATHEADDVIASLTMEAERKGFFVTIISQDKDFMQLISPNVIMVSSDGKQIYNEETVIKKFGVPPKLVPDIQALIGDTVDNIPSLSLSKRKLPSLLQSAGSLIQLIEKIEKEASLRVLTSDEKTILGSKETCLNSLQLTQLKGDINDISIEQFEFKPPDFEKSKVVLDRWEMFSLVKSLKDDFYS